MKTELKTRLDNPLLSSSRQSGLGSLTSGPKMLSSSLVNPLLQSTSSNKSTEFGSRIASSKDKNAVGSYSSIKPVSLNLKQESLSLQNTRLLLGSKLTPLTSSLLSTSKISSLQGSSHKTTLSTKSPLFTRLTSLHSTVPKKPTVKPTNTLIKPYQLAKAGFQQPSHHPKKADVESRQVVIDEALGNFEIPDYDFHFDVKDSGDQFWGQDDETSFESVNPELLSLMISSEDINSKKRSFINMISSSLIHSPNLELRKDATRTALIKEANPVIITDPEFILKVALYTRRELNIRTAANFLMALAANHRECRPYLKKYFQKSIVLPSDWASVADLYLTFHDKNLSYKSLPSALRKVMVAKFPDFDTYQLGKYNKTKKKASKKKYIKKKKPQEEDVEKVDEEKPNVACVGDEGGSEDETDAAKEEGAEDDIHADSDDDIDLCDHYTLKQLIRKLHIMEPVESVMGLVGKKYPEDLESFYKTRLPGTWDPDRAGKRMRLPTPETWETQISLTGNKAATWEQLIDHKKLPFMAMLRNLRNMTVAGVGPKYQAWIIRKLTDERTVINSKQFPLRFFSAYDVLDNMEQSLKEAEGIETPAETSVDVGRGRGRGGRQGRGRGRGRGKGGRQSAGRGKTKVGKPKEIKYTHELLSRYRKALDTAVKISTRHNVKPIRGKTYIYCDVGPKMDTYGWTGSSYCEKLREMAILLGLMCKHSCEDCLLTAYGVNNQRVIELEKGTILDNIKSVVSYAQAVDGDDVNYYSAPPSKLNMTSLYDALRDRVHIDNLIILGQDYTEEGTGWEELESFVVKYRQVVNPNLLFVRLDFDKYHYRSEKKSTHPNDILMMGYSDNILRFIAERGDSGQLNHVENIDKAYGLRELQVAAVGCTKQSSGAPEKPLPLAAPLHRWRTARVFISSTFRDMHGERDLLTRFVFPELRARAKKLFLNIYEVDLRWGVTEEETRQNRSIEICLTEVSRCDYFIGMLGDRYGYCPSTYTAPDTEEFDWLKDYPRGRSITELEMQHAALCDPLSCVGKAFFYIRDDTFMKELPPSCTNAFQVESDSSKEKMKNLKQLIKGSGLEVFDGYPCRFGGVVDGKPVTTNLEELGLRVVNNLWNSFVRDYPEEEAFLDELTHEGALHQAFLDAHVAGFSGRKTQLKQCLELIDSCRKGLVVISGKSGCGKTALMSCLATRYKSRIDERDGNHVLVHLVGAAVGSGNALAMLRRLCLELKKRFALSLSIPEDFNKLMTKFPEFLKAAAVHCGSSPLVIFLDGLDQMEEAHQAKNMEWLPKELPKDVMFVVSTVEEGQSHKALLRRSPSCLSLRPLDLLDKATVVRRMLAVHRKTLDESAFNNQMKLLVSKREANLPLFLSLACEELRVFGVFEQVSERLKRMSQTISALLQEVMQRLEVDHGKDLLSTALTLLVCAREGLLEEELHSLLSLHTLLGGGKYRLEDVKNIRLTADGMLPQAVFAQLMRSLKGFLSPAGHSVHHLSLAHGEINHAVRQRYMRGAGADIETRLHTLLAGYFMQEADPLLNGSWFGQKPRAFSELPYHLSRTAAYAELQTVLCSLPFIYAKCMLGLASQLLDDFIGGVTSVGGIANRAAVRDREKFLAKPQVQEFRSFVSRNLHIISNLPALTWQQAANEPSESAVCQSMMKAVESGGVASRRSLVVWKNKREGQEDCAMTITGFTQAVTCLAISPDEQLVVCGNKDCTVQLFERETAKEVRSFVGHYDAITDCCFVGRQRLVTASVDTTLSLWDVHQGHRIAVLKEHRRRVSSCCHSTRCAMIVSASWDCTLNIWDDSDGRLLSTLKDTTPLNCVAFHPEGRLVVTGGWDSTMKIWHVEDKKRVGILRGHKASVRAVAYSPSGAHIVSASLDGTVKIWSSTTGTQVGGLDGHVMPINRIAFSPNGRQLVTVSDDQRVKVWSGNLGKRVSTLGLDRYGSATATAISPDGMQVLTGYHSGAIRMYETNSGAEIWKVAHHDAGVKGLQWVMTPSGQLEVVAGWLTGHVELLSATTGSINTSLAAHLKPVTSLAYSSPNRLVAVTFEDNTIYLWRVPYERKAKQKTLEPHAVIHATCNGTVMCCGFDMDGTRLATGSKDKSIQIWSMEREVLLGITVRPMAEMHACHKDWVTALCWSDTSDHLVTASNDFILKLWDMKTMKVKHQFMGHTSAINSVAFSQGCVVSACFDGSVRVWSHKGVEITTLYGHNSRVNSCDVFVVSKQVQDIFGDVENKEAGPTNWASMTATEEWKDLHSKKKLDKVEMVRMENVVVATASDDAMTHLWKPLQGNEMASMSGHSDNVVAVAVSSKGHVITGSHDKTMKFWTPTLEAQILSARHNGEVTCTAYSLKATYAISASRNGEVMVWKMPEKDSTLQTLPRVVFSNKLMDKAINAVCFLSDTRFALGSDKGIVTVWDIEAPAPPMTAWRVQQRSSMQAEGHEKSPITCMAYDPSRDNLYTGHWAAMVCSFKCDAGKLRSIYKRDEKDSPDWILDLKILRDNTMVATTAAGEIQHFRNLELSPASRFTIMNPKEKVVGYQPPCWVPACAGVELRSGKLLGLGDVSKGMKKAVVAVDSMGYLSVCDVMTQEVVSKKKVHTDGVNDIAVCNDVICTASEDSALKLWSRKNLKQVGQFYCQAPVTTVTTSPIPECTEFICGDKLGNVYFLEWCSKGSSGNY